MRNILVCVKNAYKNAPSSTCTSGGEGSWGWMAILCSPPLPMASSRDRPLGCSALRMGASLPSDSEPVGSASCSPFALTTSNLQQQNEARHVRLGKRFGVPEVLRMQAGGAVVRMLGQGGRAYGPGWESHAGNDDAPWQNHIQRKCT